MKDLIPIVRFILFFSMMFSCTYVGEILAVNHILRDVSEKCTIANKKYTDFDPMKDDQDKYLDAASWDQACEEALQELRWTFIK